MNATQLPAHFDRLAEAPSLCLTALPESWQRPAGGVITQTDICRLLDSVLDAALARA